MNDPVALQHDQRPPAALLTALLSDAAAAIYYNSRATGGSQHSIVYSVYRAGEERGRRNGEQGMNAHSCVQSYECNYVLRAGNSTSPLETARSMSNTYTGQRSSNKLSVLHCRSVCPSCTNGTNSTAGAENCILKLQQPAT
jgi:hypothetical protein